MSRKFLTAIVPCVALLCASDAHATCDLCAIYSAQQLRTFHDDSVVVGASEQFTSFEKLQQNGDRIDDPANQYLKSSTTQLFARYEFTRDFALQANIPIIARRYRRPTETGTEQGSVSGVGDISLLALVSPYQYEGGEQFFRVNLQGGIKMPTGDSDYLGDESSHADAHDEADMETTDPMTETPAHDMEMSEMERMDHKHEGHVHQMVASGVHPHSLALGSGSWDLVGGASFFGQIERWFMLGSVQYLYRTEGDYDYRFADDFLWELGAGNYLIIDDDRTFALKGNLVGETKGMDKVNGEKSADTALTSLFAGPEFVLTLGEAFLGSVAFDIPVFVNNTEVSLAPDYRVRVAMTYRF